MVSQAAQIARPRPKAALPSGSLFDSAAPAGRALPTQGESQVRGGDLLGRSSRLGHDFATIPVENSQPESRHDGTSASSATQNGPAPIQRVKFTKEQRDKILAKNRRRNGGFYTCENGACGFQHGLRQYATYRGRRVGDGGFHIDHIHHHGRGGRNLIRNGRVLCGTCNTSRGARANAQRYGINKYRGLHRKRVLKDYRSMRRNY